MWVGVSIIELFISHSYFQGFMVVYDVTNEKSFDNIRKWVREIEEVSGHLLELVNDANAV